MLGLILALAALSAGASPGSHSAADLPHLRFLTATPTGAETATLQFVDAGTAAGAAEWPTDEIAWYFLRSVGYQENHDRVSPANPGDTEVPAATARQGVTMFGIDFRPAVTAMTAGELRAWLREHGFDASAELLAKLADDRPLRVRWRVSAKALLRSAADAAQEPSEISMSKSGQQAEIRLWADATVATPGDDVPLKVYADGDKLPRVDVLVWSGGARLPGRVADSAGVVNLPINARGDWRLATAGLRMLTDDSEADAEVFVATLTFDNGGKGGAR